MIDLANWLAIRWLVILIMMLANVHLAPSDDEDLYSGFGNEEVAPALQTEDIEFDEGFQVSYH